MFSFKETLPMIIIGISFLLACQLLAGAQYKQSRPRKRMPPRKVKQAIIWSTCNMLLGSLLLISLAGSLQVVDRLEEPYVLQILKLVAMLLIADTMFYWSHRLLHTTRLFLAVHAMHHTHKYPVTWTSLYVHPLEFVVIFLANFLMPLLLFKLHWITYAMYVFVVTMSLVLAHSGFQKEPIEKEYSSVVMAGGFWTKIKYRLMSLFNNEHHALHHMACRWNYGSNLGIWDRLCGTKKRFDNGRVMGR